MKDRCSYLLNWGDWEHEYPIYVTFEAVLVVSVKLFQFLMGVYCENRHENCLDNTSIKQKEEIGRNTLSFQCVND